MSSHSLGSAGWSGVVRVCQTELPSVLQSAVSLHAVTTLQQSSSHSALRSLLATTSWDQLIRITRPQGLPSVQAIRRKPGQLSY